MMLASQIRIESMAMGQTGPPGWWQYFRTVNKLPLALAFGGIMGLSSPGFGEWWLVWVTLAPFLILLACCGSGKEAALTGFCFGMSYHLVASSYYLHLYPLRWMGIDNWLSLAAVGLMWLLHAAQVSLLTAGFAWFAYSLPMRPGFLPNNQRPYFPRLLSVPIIWVFFQWIVGNLTVLGIMPLDQIAYSQYKQTALIQIAKLGGPALVDSLILLVNVALADCLIELPQFGTRAVERTDLLSSRLGVIIDLVIVLLLVSGVVAWGNGQVIALENQLAGLSAISTNKDSPTIPVAVLQNNVTIEQERFKTTPANEIAKNYDYLSNNLGVSIIVLPAAAINLEQRAPGCLMDILGNKAAAEKKEVIAGLEEGQENKLVDSACLFSAGHTRQFPMFINSMWGKIGTSIGEEIISPPAVARQTREGASLLLNLANFSRFHGSPYFHRQILAAATFRAVENQRYLILASNTGINAIIDPAGVIQSTSLGRRGTVVDKVQFLTEKTWFTKMWWL